MQRTSSRLQRTLTLLLLLGLASFAKETPADVLWQNARTGDAVYWLMNGAALRTTGHISPGLGPDWKVVGTPDLDLDGSPDILWQNMRTGDVAYWLMSGTGFVSSGTIARRIVTDWKIVGTPDLDQDGYSDILWQNTRTGDVVYWLMSGTYYTASGYVAHRVPTDWKIVGTPDLDQDGYSDLLWQNARTGDVVYWLMNGTNSRTTGHISPSTGPDWKVVGTSSLNGDGQASLIWQNARTGNVVYWLMNGTNSVASGYIAHRVPTDWKVVGTPDLAPIDLSVGSPAIPFRRTNMDGAAVQFPGDYHGKLVMLDFWASWCGPCKAEIPGLVAVYNKYHSRGFEVLGVSLDEADQAGALRSFLATNSMPWPQIYDGKYWNAEIAVLYEIYSIPQSFLIDGNTGKIVAEGDDLRGFSLDGTVAAALANMGH